MQKMQIFQLACLVLIRCVCGERLCPTTNALVVTFYGTLLAAGFYLFIYLFKCAHLPEAISYTFDGYFH